MEQKLVDGPSITLLQWNIWYKEDIENVVAFLKANRADIICLQELTREYQPIHSDTIQYVAASLGYNYHFQEIVHDDETWTQANGIFTKFPITNKTASWINEPIGTGDWEDEYRAYVETTLLIGDTKLTVATTHMSYTHRFESTPRKEREAERLAAIVQDKKQNFILTGDFNAAPHSFTVKKVSEHLKNAGPDYSQNTWTTKPFSYQGFEETELNWRLDYIFATPDLDILSSEIIQSEYSDHLPVVAKVRINNEIP